MTESYESVYNRLKKKYIKDPENPTLEELNNLQEAAEKLYQSQKVEAAAQKEQEMLDKPSPIIDGFINAIDKFNKLFKGKKAQKEQQAKAMDEISKGR